MAITTRIAASLLVLWSVGIAAPKALARPPADHPIYDVVRSIPAVRSHVVGFPADLDPAQNLSWVLHLDKRRFRIGEVIWGRLVVANSSPRVTFRCSPPFHGNHVSTISLWVSRWEEMRGSAGHKWTDLAEVYAVNKARYDWRFIHRGRPTTVAPGKKCEAWVPINVAQQPIFREVIGGSMFPACAWHPGVGFSQPGRCRFCLRFVNLERYGSTTYERIVAGSGTRLQAKGPAKCVNLPRTPVVLGRYEVEIVAHGDANPAGNETVLADLIGPWEKVCRTRVKGLRNDNRQVQRLQNIVQAMPADASDVLRWPMSFAIVRQQLYKDFVIPSLKTPQQAVATDMSTRTLANLDALLEHLEHDDPSREHVEFMRCWLLYRIGQVEAAINLAARLGTADAHVFVDECNRLQALGKDGKTYENTKETGD